MSDSKTDILTYDLNIYGRPVSFHHWTDFASIESHQHFKIQQKHTDEKGITSCNGDEYIVVNMKELFDALEFYLKHKKQVTP